MKVTGDTLFHAGSISKSFTALGVLKAVEKHLLAFDVPLKKYLPWFSVNSRLRLAGKYAGTFLGAKSEVKISLVNGHLYLNEKLKLKKFQLILLSAEMVRRNFQRVGNKLYL